MKNRKIYINESQIRLIEMSQEEVTYYQFFNHLKHYLKELLTDPNNAKPGDLFTTHGYSSGELLKKMLDRGLINRKENIKELPYEPNGDKEAKYIVKYSVPRKNFEKKMRRLYLEMFPNDVNENTVITEDGEGGGATSCGSVMQGGGTNPDAGQFITPISPIQRRKFYSGTLKRNKDEKNGSISMNRNK